MKISDSGSVRRRLTEALAHWQCRIDGPELRGGMSVVVPVRSARDVPLMLKILEPGSARAEANALRVFPSIVSVRCLDHIDALGALLLERLTAESLVGQPVDEQIIIQAKIARALAVPDPGGIEALSAGLADHLDRLRERSPRLLNARVLATAAEVANHLARIPATTLTHGDLHAANVHRDATGAWRALDPSPRVGSIVHEGHTVVVERVRLHDLITSGGRRELWRRLKLFAATAEVDHDLVVGVCQMRSALSALYEADRGNRTLARDLAWMAEALTGDHSPR